MDSRSGCVLRCPSVSRSLNSEVRILARRLEGAAFCFIGGLRADFLRKHIRTGRPASLVVGPRIVDLWSVAFSQMAEQIKQGIVELQ